MTPALARRDDGGRRVRAAARPRLAPSNDLLIVGYDREPDTLNRFSTHILEDIQTCVVEGLTTTDEQMKVVPLLATEVPTLENGGVRLRGPTAAWTSTWKLRPGVKWHDGTAVHLGRRASSPSTRSTVRTTTPRAPTASIASPRSTRRIR